MKVKFLFFFLYITFFFGQETKTPSYAPPPPPNYYLNIGDINFKIPYNFTKTEVKGEIYNNFRPIFSTLELPIPKHLYIFPKSNSDLIMFMFTNGTTDYNLGKNENLTKKQINLILSHLKTSTTTGKLESININGFNLIKHSNTLNSLRTTMYYFYDFDTISFFLVSSTGNIDNWLKVEEQILKSFERKKINSNKNSYGFFDLTINVDKNTEFSYGKDAISEMPYVFNELDKLAESAGIKDYINSKQLSNTANIYSKNIGGVMIVAKDIEYSIDNTELLNDASEVEAAKKVIDDYIDNDIPTNIDIIKSNKAEKYISKNGLCFIIKEVTAKKTNLISGKVTFDNSMFIELFHKNKWYSIVGSYQDDKEKVFIYQIINGIELK